MGSGVSVIRLMVGVVIGVLRVHGGGVGYSSGEQTG